MIRHSQIFQRQLSYEHICPHKVSSYNEILHAAGANIHVTNVPSYCQLPDWPHLESICLRKSCIRNWPNWPKIHTIHLHNIFIDEWPRYSTLQVIIISNCRIKEAGIMPYWPNIKKIFIEDQIISKLPFYSKAEIVYHDNPKKYLARRAIYFHVLLRGCIIQWRRFKRRN